MNANRKGSNVINKGGIKMVAMEPSEALAGLSEETQLIVVALTIMRNRIEALAPADRDDLFELIVVWGKTEDAEEQKNTHRAMIEILSQAKVSAKKQPGPSHLRERSKGWATHVGNKIRALRELAGLTQVELSTLAGLPQSHISRLENAEHTATHITLAKIAKALNVEVRDLDPVLD